MFPACAKTCASQTADVVLPVPGLRLARARLRPVIQAVLQRLRHYGRQCRACWRAVYTLQPWATGEDAPCPGLAKLSTLMPQYCSTYGITADSAGVDIVRHLMQRPAKLPTVCGRLCGVNHSSVTMPGVSVGALATPTAALGREKNAGRHVR